MAKRIYTEKDIQEYLDGRFEGDKKDFELWVERNSQAKNIFTIYTGLYGLIKAEEKEVADFNLADSVAHRIVMGKQGKEVKEFRLISIGMTIIGAIAIFFIANKLSFILVFSSDTIISAFAMILTAILTWTFYKAEIRQKKKKFSI